MDYSILGRRIRDERLKSKLTQAQLAEKVNVTTAYIGQIERGERKFSIETLVNISSTLKVSTDSLLRENFRENISPLTQELLSLMRERNPKDIKMAIDIINSIFNRIDDCKG